MGKIIGSQGKMANAIRTLMHAYGGQNNAKVSVVIEEPEGGENRGRQMGDRG